MRECGGSGGDDPFRRWVPVNCHSDGAVDVNEYNGRVWVDGRVCI